MKARLLVFCIIITVAPVAAFAEAMPAPAAHHYWSYPAVPEPVLSADPSMAKPVGVGPVATGGATVKIHIALPGFSSPVDLYLGIYAAPIDPVNIYLVTMNGQTLAPLSQGLKPWKTNVINPVDEFLFGDIPVAGLPEGTYKIYLMAASPPGTITYYYLWETSFVIRPGGVGCTTYAVPDRLEIVCRSIATDTIADVSVEVQLNWTIELLRNNGVFTGQGNGTWQYTATSPGGGCNGSGPVTAILTGRIVYDESCKPSLRVNIEEVNCDPFCTVSCGTTHFSIPADSASYTLDFKIENGYAVTIPFSAPGMEGTSTYTLYLR